MKLFNFFKKKQLPQDKIGNISIADNIITYNEGRGNEDENLDLNHLKYVNVMLLGDTPYLLMFSVYQHYISCNLNGFEKVYKIISERFGFDDSLFYKTINQKEEIKNRIWIKPQKTNYRFLPNKYTDFTNGFEIQDTKKQFITWDTTLNSITNLHVGEFYLDEFANEYFKFNFPIRLGNMIIENVIISTQNERKDIGIQEFSAEIYHESLTDKSYHDIKKNWSKLVDIDVEENGYERDDQNNIVIYLTPEQDVYFSIVYSYDVESNNDDGATSLYFTNNRDYLHLLVDAEFENNTNISDYIILSRPYPIEQDYRNNTNVKNTPNIIKNLISDKSAIWFDANANKIGFSDNEISIIYSLSDIEEIIIQNILPARGPGYSELLVKEKGKYPTSIFFGNETYELDYLENKLKSWGEIMVNIPEAYLNC